ncbi:lipopolysaccharide biosynthesis protein [Escherichia coli]|uniref:lipopolysaccharide biosynthesis protein n=1 Tax=Escherichia coli TaxID=562 RepID=UPI000B7CC00C|nr:lipopolysaccharide biosynthesis protein [Escherichia coli]EFJ2714765.1 lipopolysaccharide biosynthesis protein [Escherichia coli]
MGLVSNAKWNAISQLVKITVQVINIIYLTRLIEPQDYGILAMAMVVFNLGLLLRDLGTSSAIIQHKYPSDDLKNSVFWVNVILGGGLCLITIVIAPVISDFYSQPKLLLVLTLLSLNFPLSSCSALHIALLERESQFKKISFIEMSSSILSILVAILMANLGYGVYSLVASSLSMNAISTILFWLVSNWRPSLSKFINKKNIVEIMGFSANLSVFNIINYFSRNADSFLIGKFMSANILGSYNLAYRIMLFPVQSLSFVVTRSLFPILSQLQDNKEKLRIIYYNCVFFILSLTMPLMIGLSVMSTQLITFFIGSEWYLSGVILKWLAPTAIIQSVMSTAGAVFMAKGRTDILMKLGVFGAFIQCSAFLIGINYNIVIFAKLYLLSNIINSLPVMYFLLKLIGGKGKELFYTISPILLSSTIMVGMISIYQNYFLPQLSLDILYNILTVSLLGFFVYFISLLTLSSKVRTILKRIR